MSNTKLTLILLSIVNILLGILFIAFPGTLLLTLCYICGAALAVLGIVKIVCYFKRDSFGIPMYSSLALGLIDIVLMLLLFFRPFSVAVLLPIIVGIFLIVDGFVKLETAFTAKRLGAGGWGWLLALALVAVAFGALLIFNPYGSLLNVMMIAGAALIFDGVQNIFAAIYLGKNKDLFH
ncbi:MAG: DUF308 domain-containing protein [Clostridia bacterium]|nr:DUF308 domain-containing protein [Clostridia bacterium]